jgi:hypothetical protein
MIERVDIIEPRIDSRALAGYPILTNGIKEV